MSKPPFWTSWHARLHRQLLLEPWLLPKGQPLLLAVSGGQDSMALLSLLIGLRHLPAWTLTVWHGDHGWHERSGVIALERHLSIPRSVGAVNRQHPATQDLKQRHGTGVTGSWPK